MVQVLISDRERSFERRARRRKTAAKVLVGLLIAATLLTIFLAVTCNSASFGTGLGNLNRAYGNVLSDIEGITEADPRLVDIAMLGSHDAVSDRITADSPLEIPAREGVLGKLFPITSGFQTRFAKTQTVGIYDQLMQGARYIQMKYTFYAGEWYGAHSLIAGRLEDNVIDALRFLDVHPGEIVVLVFHNTYFGDKTYGDFHDWLSTVRYAGKNVYDYIHYGDVYSYPEFNPEGKRIGDLRYNDITLGGTRAGVVLFESREKGYYDISQEGASEWNDKFYELKKEGVSDADEKWHSRIGSKVLTKLIEENAERLRGCVEARDLLRVNQTQAAFSGASFGDVLRDVTSWSLLKFAERHNLNLIENPNFYQWLEVQPVFQVDFVNSSAGDFNNRVNAMIKKFNSDAVRRILDEAS